VNQSQLNAQDNRRRPRRGSSVEAQPASTTHAAQPAVPAQLISAAMSPAPSFQCRYRPPPIANGLKQWMQVLMDRGHLSIVPRPKVPNQDHGYRVVG